MEKHIIEVYNVKVFKTNVKVLVMCLNVMHFL